MLRVFLALFGALKKVFQNLSSVEAVDFVHLVSVSGCKYYCNPACLIFICEKQVFRATRHGMDFFGEAFVKRSIGIWFWDPFC